MEKSGDQIKKRPGRPKKQIADAQFQCFGIVGAPKDKSNILELHYENSILFKKIFTLFKAYTVDEVTWVFKKDRVEIITQDRLKTSVINVTLWGRFLMWYWCAADEIKICVKRNNLQRIFKNFDKNFCEVKFILKEEDYRSLLHIYINNKDMDNWLDYEVELIKNNEEIAFAPNSDNDYPLKFALPSRHFKKVVNDIMEVSPKFSIGKVGKAGHVTISYTKANNINLNSVYMSPDKIGLQSTVKDGDIFSVQLEIEYIRPFSNSSIGEKVNIAVQERKPVSLSTEVDKKSITHVNKTTGEVKVEEGHVCTIKIFTQTISGR